MSQKQDQNGLSAGAIVLVAVVIALVNVLRHGITTDSATTSEDRADVPAYQSESDPGYDQYPPVPTLGN